MSCFQDLATLTQKTSKSQHWVAFEGVVNQPRKPGRSGAGHSFRCCGIRSFHRHTGIGNRLYLFKCLRKVARIHSQTALAGNQKHRRYSCRDCNAYLVRVESLTAISTESVSLFAVHYRVDTRNLILSLDSKADGLLDQESDCESQDEAVDQNGNST